MLNVWRPWWSFTKVCFSVQNHDDKKRASSSREAQTRPRGEGRGGADGGDGCIIKNRENRRTVSRVVVRAPTKLDYFSQLLPYLLLTLFTYLPFIFLYLVLPLLVLFFFSFASFFLYRLECFHANSLTGHVGYIPDIFLFLARSYSLICINYLFKRRHKIVEKRVMAIYYTGWVAQFERVISPSRLMIGKNGRGKN